MLVCFIASHCCVTSHGYKANQNVATVHLGRLCHLCVFVFPGCHIINMNGREHVPMARERGNYLLPVDIGH